jgi:hypothetical protein
MGHAWAGILQSPLAKEIKTILVSGDKKLYALWLIQVAHLTKHTSAHQALVGTRFQEISHAYMKFCFEHALEEVGHEMMAVHDLKKIGAKIDGIASLPAPLSATEQLTAYLYYVSQYGHPATRLGFSYWAEKCYPFIQSFAADTQKSLGLSDSQMSFFVSHSRIDEKHAADVERTIAQVCQQPQDWRAVTEGMQTSLELALKIFEQILALSKDLEQRPDYLDFLNAIEKPRG